MYLPVRSLDNAIGMKTVESTCAWCGKRFAHTGAHAYVARRAYGIRDYFCSYTCMRAAQKDKKPKNKSGSTAPEAEPNEAEKPASAKVAYRRAQDARRKAEYARLRAMPTADKLEEIRTLGAHIAELYVEHQKMAEKLAQDNTPDALSAMREENAAQVAEIKHQCTLQQQYETAVHPFVLTLIPRLMRIYARYYAAGMERAEIAAQIGTDVRAITIYVNEIKRLAAEFDGIRRGKAEGGGQRK